VLGLREPGSLALPNLLAIVGMIAPLSASFGSGLASGQFHLTQLDLEQSGACAVLAQRMPNQNRQCARNGDGRHRLAATALDTQEEGAARSGPGTRAATQATSTTARWMGSGYSNSHMDTAQRHKPAHAFITQSMVSKDPIGD
jgi:hypothetical protein